MVLSFREEEKKKKKKKGEEEEKETYLENSRMFFIVTLN